MSLPLIPTPQASPVHGRLWGPWAEEDFFRQELAQDGNPDRL